MRVDDFDFDLPQELIALDPAAKRDQARLLCVDEKGAVSDQTFGALLDHLQAGDGLVLNDTRVLSSFLTGMRKRGETSAKISLNLHKRLAPDLWAAFARPAKKLRPFDEIEISHEGSNRRLKGEVVETLGAGEVTIRFAQSGKVLDELVNELGDMPLPPYIASKRPAEPKDREDYQTVYATEHGSVAAPTAGLHFTNELLDKLSAKGVELIKLTLHVGAGTFLPVKTDSVADHKMHAEWGEVSKGAVEQIKRIKASGGRICAVGTTSTRLLESTACETGGLKPFAGETDIFITPGFKFQVVDLMLTNFHLPKSTLFMLVSAFSGVKTMKQAYAHAIDKQYRFYSYGDACLLTRQTHKTSES